MNRPGPSEPSEAPPKSLRTHVFEKLAVLGFAAIFFVPLMLYGCRPEIDSWRAAAAMVEFENGNRDSAIEAVAQLHNRNSANAEYTQILASMHAENGDPDRAVEICDQWLQTPGRESEQVAILATKATALQRLGRFENALETLKQTREFLPPERINTQTRLNNLSYFRALANKEVNRAVSDMNQVVEGISESTEWSFARPVPLEARATIASGLILYRIKQFDKALKILDEWIPVYEDRLYRRESNLVREVYDSSRTGIPMSRSMEKNITDGRRKRIDRTADALALMYLVRALNLQSLDRTAEMESDRQRVAQLGFDPDSLLEKLPDMPSCLDTVESAHVFLDTRGYALFRNFEFGPALIDLNLAVQATETLELAIDSSLYNSISLNFQVANNESRDAKRNEIRRTLGTLLYHRMLLFESLGTTTFAESDKQRIRDLGYDPDEFLY